MPGIDVMDAVGTNIRIDVRGRQVMRILPRINDAVNEEWAHDKTRHHVDALVRGRLDRPWVREKGKLEEASWDEAFDVFAKQFKKAGKKVAAIAGDLLDAETMYAAKALLAGAGSKLLEGRQTGLDYDVTSLAAVRFNTTIAGDRERRRDPAGRHQSALGSAAGQHAHPQGGSARGQGVRDRARGRPDLQGRMARQRPVAARQAAQGAADAIKDAQKPVMIVGPGALGAGALGAALAASKAVHA